MTQLATDPRTSYVTEPEAIVSADKVLDKSIRCGSAVLIVDSNQDKVLLGLRDKEPNRGRWVLPGGKIEFGESHEGAAVREAREELGVAIELVRLAGKGVYHLIADNEHRMIVYSIARAIEGELHPSSDISEARYFARDELRRLDITPVVRDVLRDEGWID